ncbi:hypothetical protein GBA52_008184 [Prunus armeniaca]|nr:hypothetical protein GBA52_008184 [Prunus armeniaca]
MCRFAETVEMPPSVANWMFAFFAWPIRQCNQPASYPTNHHLKFREEQFTTHEEWLPRKEELKNMEKTSTSSEPTKLVVSTLSKSITIMLLILSSSTLLASFSASEIQIASKHPV